MDPIFAWIESSALSEWLRGSACVCAFPTIVTLHNVGMAFLAGGGVVIDLRNIGFASQMPLKLMTRFVPVMWLAFGLNAATGILLLIAYPTKALTNPVFYFKVCMIALAAWLLHRTGVAAMRAPEGEQEAEATNTKLLAVASLACWIALITAGRLLAYTRRWEMLGIPSVG